MLNLEDIVVDQVLESVYSKVFVIDIVTLNDVFVVLGTFSTVDVSLDEVVHHLEDP